MTQTGDSVIDYIADTSPAGTVSAAQRRAGAAHQRLCPLCGETSDRAGRFCSSCLGLPRPREASESETRRRIAQPWLRATGGLRWVEMVFLLTDVLVGGAAGALMFRLLSEAHHGLTAGLPATKVITHTDFALAGVVGIGVVASAVASGLLFSVWMFSAYHDVGALGLRRRWAVGWAIGSWLVPFANLWWPKRIVEELWLGSHRSAPIGAAVHRRASTPLVSTWWALLLLSGALPLAGWAGYLACHQWWNAQQGHALEVALGATVVAVICRVGNGLLAMVVVDGITTRQKHRASLVHPPAATT